MPDTLKDSLIRTLKDEYGITTYEQLLEAIRSMKKLDITQFVFQQATERKVQQNVRIRNTLSVSAGA